MGTVRGMNLLDPRRLGSWWRALRRPDPLLVVDLLQTFKAALAGTLAWVLATDVLGLEQPFLAPWAAILVVHATVYRTVSRGTQQVAATFIGVVLAWACGRLLGDGALGMGVGLLAAFLLGRIRWVRDEATTIVTTTLIVLATNEFFRIGDLGDRLFDTCVGIGVGLLVNLIVFPPLRDQAAWSRADELPGDVAEVLEDMSTIGADLAAEDAEPWVARLQRIDERIDEAWNLLDEARESSRFNPRPSKPAGLEHLRRTLHLMEQVVADSLSMARTVATSAEDASWWDDRFREAWTGLLAGTAAAVTHHDDQRLRHVRADITALADELSTDALPGSSWHEYGGLLVNLRNVVTALCEVLELSTPSDPSWRRVRRRPVRDALPEHLPGADGGGGLRPRRQGYPDRDERPTP